MLPLALKMNRCENDTKLVFAWGIILDLCDTVGSKPCTSGPIIRICVPSACCFKTTPNPQCLNVTAPPLLKGRKVSGTCHLCLSRIWQSMIRNDEWMSGCHLNCETVVRHESRKLEAGSRTPKSVTNLSPRDSLRIGALFFSFFRFFVCVFFFKESPAFATYDIPILNEFLKILHVEVQERNLKRFGFWVLAVYREYCLTFSD